MKVGIISVFTDYRRGGLHLRGPLQPQIGPLVAALLPPEVEVDVVNDAWDDPDWSRGILLTAGLRLDPRVDTVDDVDRIPDDLAASGLHVPTYIAFETPFRGTPHFKRLAAERGHALLPMCRCNLRVLPWRKFQQHNSEDCCEDRGGRRPSIDPRGAAPRAAAPRPRGRGA